MKVRKKAVKFRAGSTLVKGAVTHTAKTFGHSLREDRVGNRTQVLCVAFVGLGLYAFVFSFPSSKPRRQTVRFYVKTCSRETDPEHGVGFRFLQKSFGFALFLGEDGSFFFN